jgi:hypothetical protein
MTLHLTWSSRLWTFQLLGFEDTSTVFIEIHKGEIFDRLEINKRLFMNK